MLILKELVLMTDKREIIRYQRWFGTYARSFIKGATAKAKEAIGLKLVHSQRVRRISKDLAVRIGLDVHSIFLAELCGLFHDIGRLIQFQRYGTFVDSKSEDHALLGIQVLEKYKVFKDLEHKEQELLKDAIFVHNKFSIPSDFEGLKLVLSKILRDADKIDIWRVFECFYSKGSGPQEINLGLEPGKSISDKVLADFLKGRMVRIEDVRNQLDFMVMRLGWLYDINYDESLKILVKRGYIDSLIKRLPEGPKRQSILKRVKRFLQERLDT